MLSVKIKTWWKRPFSSTFYYRSSFNDSHLLNDTACNCQTGIISGYEILCLVAKGQNTLKLGTETLACRNLIRDLSISLLVNNWWYVWLTGTYMWNLYNAFTSGNNSTRVLFILTFKGERGRKTDDHQRSMNITSAASTFSKHPISKSR